MAKNKSLPFFFSPLLAVGIIFLANPVFGVTDILPDALGCLCLWLGLTELSYTDNRIESARGRLLFLTGIEAVKLVLTPYLSRSAVSSDMLAATAFFGVIEALLLILIMNDLYEGLSYSVSRRGKGESLRAFEGTKILAFVFIILRVLLNILPECASIFELAAHSDITNAELYYRIAGLKNYFHLLNGFIVLIVGIWWAISACGMFKRLRKDELFVADLALSYGDGYARNITVKTSAWLKNAARIAFVGLIFFFTLDFGGHSVLPNFVGTALILTAVWAMGIPLKKQLHKQFSLPVCIYAFAVQIFAYVYRAINVDLTVEFFSQLKVLDVVICALIGAAEAISFILVARMCERIFNGYVLSLCGEKTVKLMYSVKLAVYISSFIYFVGYTLPLIRGYLVLPQVLALIAVGALINANVVFVRGSVENPEDDTKICADS